MLASEIIAVLGVLGGSEEDLERVLAIEAVAETHRTTKEEGEKE